jgi:hypothetical protein
MTNILLALLLSSWLIPVYKAQDKPRVGVSIIRQQQFRNTGHHPENNRKVIFRITNNSSKPVIVYGFKYDSGFDPTGYLIVFDPGKSEWVYPTSDNRPVSWNERSNEFKYKYMLRPGRTVTFEAEMSRLEVGGRFKRTVYVAYNDGEDPMEIKSDEFILR